MDGDGLAENFSCLVETAGPYEAAPVVCAAVSGGGDSMALVLLLDGWARAKGGRVIALCVDHQLRDGSADEARRVGGWLSQRDIECHILNWENPKGASALQENARMARYQLMERWCRDNGILHLFLAHNAEDQAETFLMRLDKGSGPDGLSAMSPVSERRYCRFVRPLLAISRQELRAVLDEQNQDWIEDPSNQNPRFERIRWRRTMTEQGLSADGFCRAAERYGRTRVIVDRETARLSARCVSVHPAGFINLDREVFLAAPSELSERVLARALMAVSGAMYPPRRHKTKQLLDVVLSSQNIRRTLGGCCIDSTEGRILISRELRSLPNPVPVSVGMNLIWDRRFRFCIGGAARHRPSPLFVQALGEQGDRDVRSLSLHSTTNNIPRTARLSLPALMDGEGVLSVPHLNYRRAGENSHFPPFNPRIGGVVFQSLNSLSGSGYFVAY